MPQISPTSASDRGTGTDHDGGPVPPGSACYVVWGILSMSLYAECLLAIASGLFLGMWTKRAEAVAFWWATLFLFWGVSQ